MNSVAIDIPNQLRDLRNNTLFNRKDSGRGDELFTRGLTGSNKKRMRTAALDMGDRGETELAEAQKFALCI